MKEKTERLILCILTLANAKKIPLTTNFCFGIFSLFLQPRNRYHYDQVLAYNKKHFQKFFHAMLNKGIYLAPLKFESGFVSSTHTDNDIEQTLRSVERALQLF